MKKMIGILLVILLCPPIKATEQIKPAIKSSLASKSMLFDIANVNNDFMVAVGERGHIVRAENTSTWHQVDVPSQSTLTAVTFVNNSLGWAVGHDSIILHTANGGLSWNIQQYLPNLQKPLLDVAFKNDKEGIAIGAYGLFFRTIDGGKEWTREFHTSLLPQEDIEYLEQLRQEDEQAYLDERASILPHFNRVFMDGRTTYLVGELGLIAKSNDFGRTWSRFDEFYHGSFFDVVRTQQGNLLSVGLRGNIYRSLTNGTPWTNTETSVTALLNSIVLAGESHIFVLGNNGVLLESNDDGVSFVKKTQDDGKALISGVIFNDQLVVASEAGIKVLQGIQ